MTRTHSIVATLSTMALLALASGEPSAQVAVSAVAAMAAGLVLARLSLSLLVRVVGHARAS